MTRQWIAVTVSCGIAVLAAVSIILWCLFLTTLIDAVVWLLVMGT